MKIVRPFLFIVVSACLAGCGGTSSGHSGGGGGGTSTTVSVSFASGTPAVVAAKIGTGSFQAQSLTAGKLTLSIPSGTTDFAVAYVCPAPFVLAVEHIYEATLTDGTSFTLPCVVPEDRGPTGALTGNVDIAALPEANQLSLAVSNGSLATTFNTAADTTFNLTAPAGTDRVEVLAYESTFPGLGITSTLVAALNFDNQAVPGSLNSGAQVVLGAADRTTMQPITYTNVPAGYSASTFVGLLMASRAGGFAISQSTSQYPALPAGAFKSGDSYAFIASARNTARPTETMFVAKSATSVGPVSFAFPTPWAYSGPSPAALPTFNFNYTGFAQSTNVNQLAAITWGLTPSTEISMEASASYQNGSTTLEIPDLSAIQGFIPAPSSGTRVIWVALIGQGALVDQQPATTDSTASVTNSGTYTVP
jgi:hypothetical protein